MTTIIDITARDTMSGGAASDTFVFKSTRDSNDNRAKADVISAFDANGMDKIDLRAFGALTFIGTAAFSDTGQVRFEIVNGVTYVELNYSILDPGSDMCVALTGAVNLDAADFNLLA